MRKKVNSQRRITAVDEFTSICVDGLNYIIEKRSKNGRVSCCYFFGSLEDCLIDLSESYVLENIPDLKNLKEFSDNFKRFTEEIRRVCREMETKGTKHQEVVNSSSSSV